MGQIKVRMILIPSYATRIEGLLSQIRDKFPDKLPLQEEQRLLKDCLFHGSRKGIRDSLKYCFMQMLQLTICNS